MFRRFHQKSRATMRTHESEKMLSQIRLPDGVRMVSKKAEKESD